MQEETMIRVLKDRCDRCKVLFSLKHEHEGKEITIKEGPAKAGPFLMVIGDGKDRQELSYDMICETCAQRARNIMKMLGPVNRTRGGAKKKKKGKSK